MAALLVERRRTVHLVRTPHCTQANHANPAICFTFQPLCAPRSYAQRSLLRKVPPHVARWNPAASGTLAGKNFETAPSSVYTPPAEQQTTKPKLPKASFPMRARARRAEQDPLAWRYPAAYNDKDKQRPFESPEAPDWYRP